MNSLVDTSHSDLWWRYFYSVNAGRHELKKTLKVMLLRTEKEEATENRLKIFLEMKWKLIVPQRRVAPINRADTVVIHCCLLTLPLFFFFSNLFSAVCFIICLHSKDSITVLDCFISTNLCIGTFTGWLPVGYISHQPHAKSTTSNSGFSQVSFLSRIPWFLPSVVSGSFQNLIRRRCWKLIWMKRKIHERLNTTNNRATHMLDRVSISTP